MERDFLGLKDSEIVVKEEAVEGCKDSAFYKGSGVHWPFSAPPHFMSFKNAQEEKTTKILSDPLASSGFMSISTADAFDPKHQSCEIQNVHSMHLSHDVKMLPVSNQTISVSVGNPFFKTHFSGAGQNFAGVTLKPQILGGLPVTAPHSILPSIGSIAGTTEPWFNSKASGAPAQLTIFYAGTVNVYDDISPEKAQAIMFLAGNGSSSTSNMAKARGQGQAPTSKQAAGDSVFVNRPIMNTPPCSGLPSPMSVSSHPVGQSGNAITNSDELMAAKTTGVSITPVSKVDPPKIVTSLGPVTASTMMPSAVPQARKASLARFLEKRKERVMNSAPYNPSKKSPEYTTPGSNGASFSASSCGGSGSLSTSKED